MNDSPRPQDIKLDEEALEWLQAKINASDDPQIVDLALEMAERFCLTPFEAEKALVNSTYPCDEILLENVGEALLECDPRFYPGERY